MGHYGTIGCAAIRLKQAVADWELAGDGLRRIIKRGGLGLKLLLLKWRFQCFLTNVISKKKLADQLLSLDWPPTLKLFSGFFNFFYTGFYIDLLFFAQKTQLTNLTMNQLYN